MTICGVGIVKYKNRGDMSPSVFFMKYRVAAQGAVVGALSLGLAYTLADRYFDFDHGGVFGTTSAKTK